MIVDLADNRLAEVVNKKMCVVGTGIGGGSFIARYFKGKSDMVVIEAGSERENADVSWRFGRARFRADDDKGNIPGRNK